MAKITELMSDIHNQDLVLPEFQREYVWTLKQAKQLKVSLFSFTQEKERKMLTVSSVQNISGELSFSPHWL